jgi:hypothetical protein
MSSPPPATTSVEALDGATLAKVYAHLDPRDIVRVSAASKHLASAADEPLFRELFAQAWDEPAWPVASYRDLFLARHRATVAASAVDPAPMMASVESLAALKRGDAKGASTAHLADDARWGVVAAHAEELARAVNASETIDRTDRTIDAANVVRGLHRWLIELTTMAHARRRCLAGEAWWPTSGNRAMLAVSRALSACLTRCPRVRDALLADETQTRSRPEMFSGVPEHPPLRELLGLCVAGPPGAPPALGCGGLAGASPFAAADAAAAEDEAYGGVDHDHGAVDDATLAAAMGGAPVGTRVWPPAKSLPPRIDHCLALALAPLCLRRVAAEGDETSDADDAASRSKAYPLLVPSSFAFDAVPVPASVPSFGPWPRGGRPPHGQRVRLEKSGEPSACAAMSGAWFGARLSLDAAGGNVAGVWAFPRRRVPRGPDVAAGRHSARVDPRHGGRADSARDMRPARRRRGDDRGEVHRVRRAARGGAHVVAAREAADAAPRVDVLGVHRGRVDAVERGRDHAGGVPDVAGR